MKKSNAALVLFFAAWTVCLAAWLIAGRDRAFSENEKRYLTTRPAITWESVANGKFAAAVEDWMSDQFPARKFWAGANAYMKHFQGLNGTGGVYLCADGSLLRGPVKDNPQVMGKAAAKIADFAKAAEADCYMMLVPSAGYVRNDALPAVHLRYPDADIIERTREQAGDHVRWIDMLAVMTGHGDEALYYATDHHWTSLGAYRAYEAYCAAAGLSPVPRETFAVETVPDFYGTNWSTAALWLTPPDALEIWTDPGLSTVTTIPEANIVQEGMLFPERLAEMDKYTVFLDGNHSYLTIENPEAQGGTLLLIKDSYGHCMAPFLAAHYQKIIMVDMRYYRQSMSDICRDEGVTDVLFLYSLGTFVEASDLAFLR